MRNEKILDLPVTVCRALVIETQIRRVSHKKFIPAHSRRETIRGLVSGRVKLNKKGRGTWARQQVAGMRGLRDDHIDVKSDPNGADSLAVRQLKE